MSAEEKGDRLCHRLLIDGEPEGVKDDEKVGGYVCHGCGASGTKLTGVWFTRHALVLCELCLARLIKEAEEMAKKLGLSAVGREPGE